MADEIPPHSLKQKLQFQINRDGPIPVATYMQRCLHDPHFGYYTKKDAIGKKGDFITAPEVSQMFGELIGIWCINVWQKLGKPEEICLVEAGPGHATLMADCLRAITSQPAMVKATNIILVEASAKMRDRQARKLKDIIQPYNSLNWTTTLDELPHCPTLVIGNEFLDALPIRQFSKKGTAWHEVGVNIDHQDNLSPVLLAPLADPAILPQNAQDQADGAVFEWAPAREAIIEQIATHIISQKGAALFIDYGHSASGFADTFQAISNHQYTNPYANPGKADVTSHVDFERLALAAKSCGIDQVSISTQAQFLLQNGLLERAGTLGSGKSAQFQNEIHDAVERLASPTKMGKLFKVLEMFNTE